MHKYVFILGRKWKLSAAEIISVLGDENVEVVSNVLIKSFNEPVKDVQMLLNKLGGTVKIGKVFGEFDDFAHVPENIIEYLDNQPTGKTIFGVSFHTIAHSSKKSLNKLLKQVKVGLRQRREGKIRFVNKMDQNVKSVVVHDEKLVEKGTDITIIQEGNKYLLAFTEGVQNFRKYSLRDYDRPRRDVKSGMLPPKLAQMMINLACGDKRDSVIYDAFCGSGTVLTEGLLMGHKVAGSDISEKAIDDSKVNMEWFAKEFELDKSNVLGIFVKDAREVKMSDFVEQPDFVVSETYLGPPLFKIPNPNEIKKNFDEIEALVIDSLKNLKDVVKPGGAIVFAVPFYRDKNNKYFLENLVEKAEELKFEVVKLDFGTQRGSLLYDRSDQVVGREIFKFKIY